ncbi:MAG: M20/M25/M40 family metallo-hydrolase [Clostridia bacterium]|nr:M20/M25/M40 family metallo-hydrolase [Clostridia bacterium]
MITSEQIKKYVEEHEAEALQCIVEAVQSPSPTGAEQPMRKMVEKWLGKLDVEVNKYFYDQDRPNFIAEWKGTDCGKEGTKTLLFNGHMDVFPVEKDDEDPDYNPWSGEIKDGYVIGRGACDMKGGDCAAMMAVKFLQEMGFDPNGKVILNYVSDEERGGEFGTNSLLNDGFLNADFGISMEPTDNCLKLGHGAIYPCSVVVYGDGGSSSEPIVPNDIDNIYGGEDAIKKAMKALTALNKLQDEVISKKTTKFGSSLYVTKINAGKAVNNYARECEICIDRRFSSPETVESVDAEICAALDEIKKTDPTFAYKFAGFYEPMTPEFDIDVESDVCKALSESYKAVYGKEVTTMIAPAGSDMAFIKDKWGYQTPILGPGTHKGVAGKYEMLRVDNYLNCIQIYMNSIVKLLSK